VQVEVVRGPAIERHLGVLARLRIEVFAEWPYLCAGDLDYEERYLSQFARAKQAVLVLAREGEEIVGASSALPLSEEHEELTRPLSAPGERPEEWYYLAESVLRTSYRGRGLGRRFFDGREGAGRQFGFGKFAFCAVERSPSDPRRPAGGFDLEPFWERLGYRRSDLVAQLSWREHDEAKESNKPLRFWLKGERAARVSRRQ
jgi:GNAT superfamily N-acetyltransferase